MWDNSPFVFLAMAFAGPMGAAGGMLLVMLVRRRLRDDLLDAWYERLANSAERDGGTAKFRDIVSQRARASRAPSIRNFDDVMAHGTVAEKQTLLGIFALQYQSRFFPLLKQALRDREPTIRVQAAAVFARLRGQYKNRLRSALQAASPVHTDPQTVVDGIDNLQLCIRSGFLDTPEVARARRKILQARNGKATKEHYCRDASDADRKSMTENPKVAGYPAATALRSGSSTTSLASTPAGE